MRWKARLLWALFAVNVLSILVYSLFVSKTDFSQDWIILALPVIALFLHALWTLGIKYGLIFIITSAFIGFVAEAAALEYGVIFGGDYSYNMDVLFIAQVPLLVILYWAVFIYTGYCIVNSFLYWTNKKKPSKKNKNLMLLPLLVIFDGLVVLAIDLFMDPLQVIEGYWSWSGGGPYFNIPIGNFVGWFMVASVSTGIFRLFEYYKPHKAPRINKSVFLIPVLGYGAISVAFTISAFKNQIPILALIGCTLMLPLVLINFYIYKYHFYRLTKPILQQFQPC